MKNIAMLVVYYLYVHNFICLESFDSMHATLRSENLLFIGMFYPSTVITLTFGVVYR